MRRNPSPNPGESESVAIRFPRNISVICCPGGRTQLWPNDTELANGNALLTQLSDDPDPGPVPSVLYTASSNFGSIHRNNIVTPSFCTHCGATLLPGATACAECHTALAPAAAPTDASRWGIRQPALGLMVLVPTAVLIASLALVIPLAVAAVISATALGLLQVLLVWLLGIRTWPLPWALAGFTKPRTSLRASVMLAAAALVCSLGFAQLYTMAALALGWDFLMPPEIPDGLLLPGGWVVFSALALAVWTPIAEETFFRGFVQRGLTNRWRLLPALVVSAAVFAALHLAPALLLPVFVTGLLLGFLYHRTGSLWPCIAVHAAQNLVAVLGAWFGL